MAEDSTYTEPKEIESLCINCGANGVTKLLLTRIPHYKESILTVPELELEIPPKGQKGEISTVPVSRTVAALEQDQPVRRIMDPDGAKQIDKFVAWIQDTLWLP